MICSNSSVNKWLRWREWLNTLLLSNFNLKRLCKCSRLWSSKCKCLWEWKTHSHRLWSNSSWNWLKRSSLLLTKNDSHNNSKKSFCTERKAEELVRRNRKNNSKCSKFIMMIRATTVKLKLVKLKSSRKLVLRMILKWKTLIHSLMKSQLRANKTKKSRR